LPVVSLALAAIGVAENIASVEECNLLRFVGGPHLNPSVTATPDGQRLQVQLRTSFDMVFEEMLEDISIVLIQRRMAAVVDTTPAYSENLQLLRYQPDQEYRPHRDYLPPSLITPLEEGGSGQRESTVIIYLNDMENGGETEFIELDKKIAPKTGRILAFRNLHLDGSPDTRTLHAGLPVANGSKWIATLWIHQGVFRK
ncbi:MAG: 2OG-Fe(II) oxygenase, partial [Arenimonas sp.]